MLNTDKIKFVWFCAHLAVNSSVMLTVLRFSVIDILPWHSVKHFMNVILGLLWICYFYDDRFDIIYIFKIFTYLKLLIVTEDDYIDNAVDHYLLFVINHDLVFFT